MNSPSVAYYFFTPNHPFLQLGYLLSSLLSCWYLRFCLWLLTSVSYFLREFAHRFPLCSKVAPTLYQAICAATGFPSPRHQELVQACYHIEVFCQEKWFGSPLWDHCRQFSIRQTLAWVYLLFWSKGYRFGFLFFQAFVLLSFCSRFQLVFHNEALSFELRYIINLKTKLTKIFS